MKGIPIIITLNMAISNFMAVFGIILIILAVMFMLYVCGYIIMDCMNRIITPDVNNPTENVVDTENVIHENV
jgi:hypothetical protein